MKYICDFVVLNILCLLALGKTNAQTTGLIQEGVVLEVTLGKITVRKNRHIDIKTILTSQVLIYLFIEASYI